MIPDHITLYAKYEPAMHLTTQFEADHYLADLVEHNMRVGKTTCARAHEIERSNLGYWAGYHDKETRLRVEKLFACEHPILGKASRSGDWSPEEILQEGIKWGQKWQKRRSHLS
jgi:hypothetical protein